MKGIDSTSLQSGSKWYPLKDPCDYMAVPECGGCYAIYTGGRLAYLGQSRNLRQRFREHKIRPAYSNSFTITPWGVFQDVKVKIRHTQKYGDWAMIELRLIQKLRPPQNCVGSIRKRGAQA